MRAGSRRFALLLALMSGCKAHVPKDESAAAPPAPVNAPAAPTLPPDRDADTIPDARDACPDEPEDLDRFEDNDGCVDRDNDGDRIPDAHEFTAGRWTNCDFMTKDGVDIDCRNLMEDHDGRSDLDGCPMFAPCEPPPPFLVLHYRRPGRLSAAELGRLEPLIRRLHEAPSLRASAIVHVDRHRDTRTARRLTYQTLQVVERHLITAGIAGRVLLHNAGDGLADDPTPEGRAASRRIEFVLDDPCLCDPECRQQLVCR